MYTFFPLASSTLLSRLLPTISSIVQGQDSSSGMSQGTTLCGVKAPSYGNLSPASTEPTPWIHPEHTGNQEEPQNQISAPQKAINQTHSKHTRRGEHTCLKEHKRGRSLSASRDWYLLTLINWFTSKAFPEMCLRGALFNCLHRQINTHTAENSCDVITSTGDVNRVAARSMNSQHLTPCPGWCQPLPCPGPSSTLLHTQHKEPLGSVTPVPPLSVPFALLRIKLINAVAFSAIFNSPL